MALNRVQNGQIATIVTSLHMRARPSPRPLPSSRLRLERWHDPRPDRYRTLFRRIGEPWLWFSRLVMEETALLAIIHDPAIEIYAVTDMRGVELGMLELDFRTNATCEIAFFGLVPPVTGRGEGSWLMAHTLNLAWRAGIERVWVHTCTLDHPRALGFYRAQGFEPYARAIETFADPRISGVLPREAAQHIPLIAG